jgi:hypothetical protein
VELQGCVLASTPVPDVVTTSDIVSGSLSLVMAACMAVLCGDFLDVLLCSVRLACARLIFAATQRVSVALCLQCVAVSQPLLHAQFSVVAGLDDYRRQHGDGSSCREDVGGSRQSGSDAAPALAAVSSDVEDAAMQCGHGTAAAETAVRRERLLHHRRDQRYARPAVCVTVSGRRPLPVTAALSTSPSMSMRCACR